MVREQIKLGGVEPELSILYWGSSKPTFELSKKPQITHTNIEDLILSPVTPKSWDN